MQTTSRRAGRADRLLQSGAHLPQEEMTMPQTATQTNRKGTGQKAAQAPRTAPTTTGELSTEDQVYGLVSVLYHALQGAETSEQYIDDAERAGDEELVRFFEQCREQDSERASRAKALLAARIADEDDDEEEDEDDEDDDEEEAAEDER
jgi:hypothetical protein